MSAENKKLLWISISACAFVLVLAATGFFLFAPKKSGAAAPATVGNTAAPKAADPQEFLMAPPPAPKPDQGRGSDGGVVVVYGDKPPATVPAAPVPAPVLPSSGDGKAAQPPAAVGAESSGAAQKGAGKSAAPVKAAPKKVKVEEYWIQAASFASRARADELRDLLASKGIAALISVKDISGKSWYRVRVGPYSGKAEADGWLGRLKALPNCAEAYVAKTLAERTK